MEENKYYTPTIEELHVGYECEVKNSADAQQRFNKVVIDKDFLPIFLRVKQDSLRTKYLDKKDILSLGWTEKSSNVYTIPMVDPKKFGYQFFSSNELLYLSYDNYEDPYRITIHNDQRYEDYNQWFSGECKSINELKKIMQYLNIN